MTRMFVAAPYRGRAIVDHLIKFAIRLTVLDTRLVGWRPTGRSGGKVAFDPDAASRGSRWNVLGRIIARYTRHRPQGRRRLCKPLRARPGR